MSPHLATGIVAIGIWLLFNLDRDRSAWTSKALWIPILWLWIAASRPASQVLAIVGFEQAEPGDLREQYLDGSPLDRNIYAGLILLALVVLVRRGPEVGRLILANGPILAFLLYCALSVCWSDHPDVAFKRWIKAFGDVVMVLIVLTDPGKSAIRRFLQWPGFFLIPMSVLFIRYYPDLGRVYNPWTWTWTYTGVTMGKNLLGGICVIFGLVSVWRVSLAYRDLHGPTRARLLIGHGVFLAMIVWLLWTANSMTSLWCFALGGSLIVAARFPSFARRPLPLVTAVIALSVFTLFSGFGGGALEAMGRDPTLTGRTAVWDLVLNAAGNPFIGAGFESFWLGERLDKIWKLYKGLNEAHNGYLEVFLNLGWIGLILLGGVIVTGYRNVAVTLRRDQDAGSLKLAYYVVCLVYSLTEAGFRMLTPIWIGFLLSAVAVPERRESISLQPSDQTAGFWTDATDHRSDGRSCSGLAGDARLGQAPPWIDMDVEERSKCQEQA